jgi:hypothetical protein
MELRNCQDCGAHPGDPHDEDCDTARCLRTGQQRIMCGFRPVMVPGEFPALSEPLDVVPDAPHPGEDCGQDIWTGQWPGEADAIRLGWYCYFVPNGDPCWVRCGPDHPDAVPDLNRLAIDGRWDRELLRWEARSPARAR